jgi:hypothetical protein
MRKQRRAAQATQAGHLSADASPEHPPLPIEACVERFQGAAGLRRRLAVGFSLVVLCMAAVPCR